MGAPSAGRPVGTAAGAGAQANILRRDASDSTPCMSAAESGLAVAVDTRANERCVLGFGPSVGIAAAGALIGER